MRKAMIGVVAAVGLLAAGGGVALGGAKQLFPLNINAAGRFASGGLAETHNTADTMQYAECGTNGTTGFCTLRDTAGTYYSCFTTDAANLAVIRSMSPDGYFSISWDAAGTCTYVLSYASSRSAVKLP